ncbi:hypothetical protein E2C01_031448 [Portunus trituberculatus]|uniref:Uncharacterized protein n=1 Tax=Portunus trituberculatus TaxID=210409 RepID=A0A5B7EUJ7_PORTR|nr:hypothetical protein [Portunus trituberculatus]
MQQQQQQQQRPCMHASGSTQSTASRQEPQRISVKYFSDRMREWEDLEQSPTIRLLWLCTAPSPSRPSPSQLRRCGTCGEAGRQQQLYFKSEMKLLEKCVTKEHSACERFASVAARAASVMPAYLSISKC